MTEDTTTENGLRSDEHEFNPSWSWTESFAREVRKHISGRSLKVCTGMWDICDVNVDIDPALGDVTADMFNLPFTANSFDTVVTDPPWLDLTQDEKQELMSECVRVCKPDGTIICNATWIPDHRAVEHEESEFRVRQEDDFAGNTSVKTVSAKHNLVGLYATERWDAIPGDSESGSSRHQQQVVHNKIRAIGQSGIREDYESVDVDPRAVDSSHSGQRCPMCLNQGLEYVGDSPSVPEGVEFLCPACEFRSNSTEVRECGELDVWEWKQLPEQGQEARLKVRGWSAVSCAVKQWLWENRPALVRKYSGAIHRRGGCRERAE